MVNRDLRLAIDSATDRLSVAAQAGGAPPVGFSVDGARQHAARLLPLIDEAMAAVGRTLAALEIVAVSDGPGSFTGLRVGIAAAKAMVAGTGASLWTAPSLLVRAAALPRADERVLAMTSALRGEVYAGVWRLAANGAIACLMAPRTIGLGDVGLVPEVDRVVGDAPDDLVAALRAARGLPAIDPGPPSASALLGLIGTPGGAHRVEQAATWEPTYGRPAEAQAKWEREHGRALPDPTDLGR
jgi:tRNA threonylcarbamoyladenosine biosynthesis protein TsaB